MSKKRNPYIRVPLVIAFLIMLYFIPTREFLKTTFMLGIPFIFLLGLMVRKRRYSWLWNLCALGLLLVVAVYGYQLVHLPERIQVRTIISHGAALVAEGKYDEAIAGYQQLEKLGLGEQMKQRTAIAQSEKVAQQQLEAAREMINNGYTEGARQVLSAINPQTRAAQEARELLKTLK